MRESGKASIICPDLTMRQRHGHLVAVAAKAKDTQLLWLIAKPLPRVPGFRQLPSIMFDVKSRWLILLTIYLALIGTVPRLHCLCHNSEVLLITAPAAECCHEGACHKSASFNSCEASCFRDADSNTLSGSTWSPDTSSVLLPTVAGPSTDCTMVSKPFVVIAGNTRAPPYLREYTLGLYLLHSVLLS